MNKHPAPATSAGISFYHLTTTPLERALPKLLEKAYAGGFKTLLLTEPDTRMEQLNQLLWMYDPGSFLPHGSSNEAHPESQPILLSTELNAKNNANLLVVTHGVKVDPTGFERVLDIFPGNDETAVESARSRWKEYKNQGYTLNYFRQTEQGGWEKKMTEGE